MATELNISEEEQLAQCVRQYPVIYTKSNASRDDVEEVWALVVDQLDFVGRIGEAKRFWYNLRKKYTKRLLAYNNFSMTGNNETDPAVQALLEPYSFMRWIDEYLDSGSTKDYSILSGDTPITSPELTRKFMPRVEREDSRQDDPLCRTKSVDSFGSKTNLYPQMSNGSNGYASNNPNRKNVARNCADVKPASNFVNSLSESGVQILKSKADELFGQMIAEELTQFDEIEKCSIKLDIRRVILEKLMARKSQNSAAGQKSSGSSPTGSNKDLAFTDCKGDVSEPAANADLVKSTVHVNKAASLDQQNSSSSLLVNNSSETTKF